MPVGRSVWRRISAFAPDYKPNDEQLRKLTMESAINRPKMLQLLRQARNIGIPSHNTKRKRNTSTGCFVININDEDIVNVTDAERGLLIHKRFIDAILDPKQPKTWELRTKRMALGKFYLIETQGGGIRGVANIVEVREMTRKQLLTRAARKKHCITNKKDIRGYVRQSCFVYVLEDIVAYEKSIPFTPMRGCIDVVKTGLENIKRF